MIKKIFFDITKLCNAKCIYCFTNSTNFKDFSKNELTDSEIFSLIDEVHNLGISTISIGGGEPFLRNITSIGNYANGKVKLSITSNGTILNDDIINFLKNSKIKLTISLDTVDENISKKVRTGINLSKVLKNIEYLCKCPEILPQISLRTVISTFNYKHIFEIIEFCNKNKIKNLKVNSTNYFGRAKEHSSVILSFDNFVDLLDDIKEYCKKQNILTNVELPISKYLTTSNDCLCGNTSVYIDSVGNVFPCAFTEGKMIWGNIKNLGLSRILERYKNFSHSNELCNNCPINRYKGYNKDFSKLNNSNF